MIYRWHNQEIREAKPWQPPRKAFQKAVFVPSPHLAAQATMQRSY